MNNEDKTKKTERREYCIVCGKKLQVDRYMCFMGCSRKILFFNEDLDTLPRWNIDDSNMILSEAAKKDMEILKAGNFVATRK